MNNQFSVKATILSISEITGNADHKLRTLETEVNKIIDSEVYTDFITFHLHNGNVNLIDKFLPGDTVVIYFSLRGKRDKNNILSNTLNIFNIYKCDT
jgi:hypothetical protein